ncbi:MAG TPA: NAD(P)-binding domain-containing protein [Candidatus Sulfotelmatobacter sp.]|nr:NAD(P)-binding domain-containing protein [Candidatus Sulfotelmatobacter sp.]
MKLAIIGAGNVGQALAGAAVRAGHAVRISAAHAEHAQAAAAATGATAAASNRAALEGADVVLLAVPGTAFPALVQEVGPALAGRIVVDTSNVPTPDPSGTPATSAAEALQARLPEARVIKAFNTLFASRQAAPVVEGQAVDGYVAGDDAAAKEVVLRLAESIGLRPIDVGGLVMARTLEAMAWLNISLQLQNGWAWQTGWRLVGPTSKAA